MLQSFWLLSSVTQIIIIKLVWFEYKGGFNHNKNIMQIFSLTNV